MLHGFYFRFFRMIHCEWIAAILSHMAYIVFYLKYMAERLNCKKRIVTASKEDALKMVSGIHQDGYRCPEFNGVEYNPEIDLSIIVPVYNYVDLIEKNIISILSQKTQYKYELILVDDGSTDGAQDILHKYETHPNVNVIFQQNQGIAGARNTGLANAAGRYIMFIDCDDVVEDNLVEILMSRAYKEDCDIVMCAHNLVKERDGKVYETLPNIYPKYNMLGYAKNAYILNFAGLPWCKVYKRELWKNVRYLPGYWFEDTIIHSLIFTQCKKFAYEPEVCYQYRWYESNFSHTQNKSENPKSIDTYWMLLHILEQYESLGFPKDERFETMLLKHLSAYYYNKIHGLEDEVVEALFVLACDLYKKYGIQRDCKLPYMLRVTKKALEQGDMNLWILATKYQK